MVDSCGRISLNLPNGEFIIEFSALSSRLNVRVESHQCANQIILRQLMIHDLQPKVFD